MAILLVARYPEPVMVFQAPGEPPPRPMPVGRFVHPKEGPQFSLEELQTYVGGPIEISSLPDGRYFVSNERGKLEFRPVNVDATIIYRSAWKGRSDWAAADTVVGDVLICDPTEMS